jgi:rRNA-processing protein FCF1
MNRFFNKGKDDTTQKQQKIILDTCSLIDGRVVDIAKAGFIPEDVIIPQFVIAELQYLADKGDSQKRERARFGLDVIRHLQDLGNARVIIAREKFPNIKEVDDKLVALAKQYRAPLYTTDYNLNKVAQIEGVTVLNVNELAQALRPHHLPGEKATVKLVQPGQDPNQAVGYLDNGTMVVVENARRLMGQKVEVTFTRMLQTQAGKMSFATIDKPGNSRGGDRRNKQPNQPQAQPQQPAAQPQPQAQAQPKPQQPLQQQQRPQEPRPKQKPQQQQRREQSNPQQINRRRPPRSQDREDAIISLINDSQ